MLHYFLLSFFSGGRRLNGLIYVHRISDPRMGAISKRNLRLFKQLCGEDSLRNVCITTTNWDRVTKDEGDRWELELRENPNFFKPLIDEGAQLARHYKDIMSARSIVNFIIHKDPTKLQIQIELDAGKTLEETSTGAGLHEEILALRAKQDAELQDLKKKMEKAAREKHAELLARLEEERRKGEAQRKKMEEGLENLKMQVRSDKVKQEGKIRLLEDKAKQIKAELLAERRAREELERNNRALLDLLKQEADLPNLNKRLGAETKTPAVEYKPLDGLKQVKGDKEKAVGTSMKGKERESGERDDSVPCAAKKQKPESQGGWSRFIAVPAALLGATVVFFASIL